MDYAGGISVLNHDDVVWLEEGTPGNMGNDRIQRRNTNIGNERSLGDDRADKDGKFDSSVIQLEINTHHCSKKSRLRTARLKHKQMRDKI